MDKLAKLELARDIKKLAMGDPELNDIIKMAKDPSLYDRYNEAKDAWLNDCAVAAESLSKGEDVQFRADKVGGGFMYMDVQGKGIHSGLSGTLQIFFPGGEYGEVVAKFKSDNREYQGYDVRWTIIVQTPQSFYYQFLKRAFKELRGVRASNKNASPQFRAEVVAQRNGAMVNLFAASPTDDPTMIDGYQQAEPMERATPESKRLEKDAKKVLAIFRQAMGIHKFTQTDLAGPHQWVHDGEDVTRMTIMVYKRGYEHDRKDMANRIAAAVKRLGYRITEQTP